jgi:spermidine/putrescine transport system permease protein
MTGLRFWFLLPGRIWMAILFVAPLLIILAYSFLTRGDYGGVESPATLENYTRVADPIYAVILFRSLWIAALSTLICLVLAFPLALFIANSGKRRNFYLQMVILPFWTSLLVRTYAWVFLLRDTGLVNTLLLHTGLIHTPRQMLYRDGAVLLGLVYSYLPFAVLPLYTILEKLDPALLEAAADLGARPLTAIRRVTLPLAAPGFVAAAILVFIPCLGSYLTSDLLGGGKTVMAGNLIQNQFTTSRDWPFGAVVSLVLMAVSMLMLLTVSGRQARDLV